jgi:hypothetical protein
MTITPSIDRRRPLPASGVGGGLREGVARRHGRRRNPTWRPPRSSLDHQTVTPRSEGAGGWDAPGDPTAKARYGRRLPWAGLCLHSATSSVGATASRGCTRAARSDSRRWAGRRDRRYADRAGGICRAARSGTPSVRTVGSSQPRTLSCSRASRAADSRWTSPAWLRPGRAAAPQTFESAD